MAGVNKVIIIGNLGADPDVRTMPNGTPVANINVATSETWTDRNTNERREVTEWHRIVLYRRLAEIAGEYLRKGSKVYVEGKLKTRKWQDQSGQDRYTTEIQADSLQMLDSRGQQGGGFNQGGFGGQPQQGGYSNNQGGYGNQGNFGGSQAAPAQPKNTAPAAPALDESFDDDIPF